MNIKSFLTSIVLPISLGAILYKFFGSISIKNPTMLQLHSGFYGAIELVLISMTIFVIITIIPLLITLLKELGIRKGAFIEQQYTLVAIFIIALFLYLTAGSNFVITLTLVLSSVVNVLLFYVNHRLNKKNQFLNEVDETRNAAIDSVLEMSRTHGKEN